MKWKHIPPILLIVDPLLMILPFLLSLFQLDEIARWLFTYTVTPIYSAYPVIIALNVLCAYFAPWDTEELACWNLRIKLLLIPVYLFVAFLFICVPIAFPLLFTFDWLLLMASSGYGIRALFRAKKEFWIDGFRFWAMLIGHFCFIADVVAASSLQRKLK